MTSCSLLWPSIWKNNYYFFDYVLRLFFSPFNAFHTHVSNFPKWSEKQSHPNCDLDSFQADNWIKSFICWLLFFPKSRIKRRIKENHEKEKTKSSWKEETNMTAHLLCFRFWFVFCLGLRKIEQGRRNSGKIFYMVNEWVKMSS